MCGVDLSTPADDTTAEGYTGCSAACASVVLPWVADCTASQACVDADRSGDDAVGGEEDDARVMPPVATDDAPHMNG